MIKKSAYFLAFLLIILQFPSASGIAITPKNNPVANTSSYSNDSIEEEFEKIQKAIDKIYGNSTEFEKEGSLYFDSEGNAVFLMKDLKNEKTNQLNQELRKNVTKDEKLVMKEVQYSTDKLKAVTDDIADIVYNYDPNLFRESVHISMSIPEQKVVVKSKEPLPIDLQGRITFQTKTYADVIEFEVTDDLIIFTFTD